MGNTARALALVLLLALPGCGTLSQACDGVGPAALGGTRQWISLVREHNHCLPTMFIAIGFAVSGPLDLAADVALLPVALGNELFLGRIEIRYGRSRRLCGGFLDVFHH